MRAKQWRSVAGLYVLALGISNTSCNSILGLNKLSIEQASKDAGTSTGGSANGGSGGSGGGGGSGGTTGGGASGSGGDTTLTDASASCTTNNECTALATQLAADAGDGGTVPAVCTGMVKHCVNLYSVDCSYVTGDYTNDKAIIIGSLFSTKGSQGATNLPRQQSATLAVEEINNAGGVPSGQSAGSDRPLVMVSCDESTNLLRAAGHLVTDLGVPAIVGPNTSQDTIDVSNGLTIMAGTLVISPTGVASSIGDLVDNNLTWLMVPTDVQRAPLMISQINDLETMLKTARNETAVKLSVIFRNDALGVGTRTALNSLTLNGKSLADNLGSNVQITGYDYKQPNQDTIVAATVKFAPDIVVLAGTAEAITEVMAPLEKGWPAAPGGDSGVSNRPYYMLIDSVKVPELITAVTGDDDLRHRVRGTGVTPEPQSAPVYSEFQVDYLSRYPGTSAKISGMGQSYDATYAIAYAMAATGATNVSGASIASGLSRLTGGGSTFTIQSTQILASFQQLVSGSPITAIGTFAPLAWDKTGEVVGGRIEMWCINGGTPTPAFGSSGLTYDIETMMKNGTYAGCPP
ncbi:MAG TPA: ABC transporter substrate-binding protein [Polyangiaceae bacterium]|nr:ABC transporter substrate-binding protein [Polyangiaceae bacterium]